VQALLLKQVGSTTTTTPTAPSQPVFLRKTQKDFFFFEDIMTLTAPWFCLAVAVVIMQLVTSNAQKHKQSALAFADKLARNMYHVYTDSDSSERENDCTSALSISMCMSLIYPGSVGSTQEQLRKVFGFPSNPLQLSWSETSKNFNTDYSGECVSEYSGMCREKKPKLAVYYSIWLDEKRNLTAQYKDVVGQYLIKTNFTSSNAGSVLNNWVSNKTNGLIKKVVPLGPILYAMVAINAIYLNASWSRPFAEEMTTEDKFYHSISKTQSSNAHFMHLSGTFGYVQTADFQIVKLPYSTSALSMIICLPLRAGKTISAEDLFSVDAIIDTLKSTKVAITLPKFQFSSSYTEELKNSMISMGLTAPFSGGFHNMVEQFDEMKVSSIIHKTFINVYEKGTEAAAVTAALMKTVSVPKKEEVTATAFLANRPFQFFIYDSQEKVAVFEGNINEPGIPKNSVAKLKGDHTSAEFWRTHFDVAVTMVSSPFYRNAASNFVISALVMLILLCAT